MKKIFTIVAAALLFACAANAQTYFNLGYGYGMNKVQFGELDPDTVGSNAITAGVSHNFGIAGNFGIEAGLNYMHDWSWEGLEAGESKGAKKTGVMSRYDGLNVPVLLNYAFPLASDFKVKVLAGPKMFLGLSDKSTTYVNGEKGLVYNSYEDDDLSRFNVSASFGVAGEWMDKFRFMLGYDLGINDMDKSDLAKRKQSMLTFTLGYIF